MPKLPHNILTERIQLKNSASIKEGTASKSLEMCLAVDSCCHEECQTRERSDDLRKYDTILYNSSTWNSEPARSFCVG